MFAKNYQPYGKKHSTTLTTTAPQAISINLSLLGILMGTREQLSN